MRDIASSHFQQLRPAHDIVSFEPRLYSGLHLFSLFDPTTEKERWRPSGVALFSDTVEGIDPKCKPNEDKAESLCGRGYFTVKVYTDCELDGRGKVLEHTERGEWDPLSRYPEKQEWGDSDYTAQGYHGPMLV
jgi:hypothetical protein